MEDQTDITLLVIQHDLVTTPHDRYEQHEVMNGWIQIHWTGMPMSRQLTQSFEYRISAFRERKTGKQINFNPIKEYFYL